LQAELPNGLVSFCAGDNLDEAARAAKSADVAIVFAYQWEAEGSDLGTLSLPSEQNKLIERVSGSNPRTIVVLETGSPVTMPWIDNVATVIEAWYPGIRGAEALANIITGKVNPAGKLVITFPKNDDDLPHPRIVMPPPESQRRRRSAGDDPAVVMAELARALPPFQVYYDEKLKVGYKWYDAEKKGVLFPFGFGLSYTAYSYSNLNVRPGQSTSVSFKVTNSGKRAGTEIAEIYASLPEDAGEPPKRLVGWARVDLAPGESKEITVPILSDRLMVYDEPTNGWKLVNGAYTFMVGGSSQDLPLKVEQQLTAKSIGRQQ
jgi:beta-glucosidase